jgi:hypothetical protein
VFTWNMDLWLPWTANAAPEDLARPTRLADCARQFAVMRQLGTEAIREGRVPLWNRWIYCGTPFLANFQPGVFYPPNLVLALSDLTLPDAMTAYLVFHLLVAVWGTFVLLRLFGVSAPAALFGAVVFGWSGYNAARTGIPTMVATGSWLPWVLAATQWWLRRGTRGAWAAMAGALALAGLAGFAQIFVFVLYAWVLFGLLQGLAHRPATTRRRWTGWAAAGVVALLLVSVHLVPALEFRGLAQDATNSGEMLASGTLHPLAAGKLVVPDLLGNATVGDNATHLLSKGSGYYFQTERSTAVYAGILPLLLLGVVLLAPGDHRRHALFALAIALGGLAFSFGTPLLPLLARLPGLAFSRPDRAVFLWCFGAALGSGIGAHRLASREGPDLRRSSNGLGLLLGGAATIFCLLAIGFRSSLLPARILEQVGPDHFLWAAAVSLVVALLSTGIFLLRASGRLGARTFLLGALVLLAADLARVALPMNVMQPKDSIFRPVRPDGSLAFLRARRESEGPFRILRFDPRRGPFSGILPPSTAALYEIEDALGFDSLNLARIRDVMAALDPEIVVKRGNFRAALDPRALDSPLLDALNVRYVLARDTIPLPGLELVHASDAVVFENADARPRAFLVDEVRVIEDGAALVRAMAQPSFRPDLWAYSEEAVPGLPPPGVSGAAGAASGDRPSAGTARIVSYRDEEVTVAVAPERGALLVLADAHYPGWKALVDGREVPIHRVNHTFRGVVVEPGERNVVFKYEPVSFRAGALLSLLGLAAWAAGIWACQRHGAERSEGR